MQSEKILDDFEITPYLKKMILFASGGPFLDGYVLVIIGVALVQLGPELNLNAYWSALVGASALAGIFIGSALFGYITDLVGRQKMFTIDVIVIAIISLGTMIISSPMQLVIMRFLIGVVIGADYPIATSLVSEFTPRKYRAISMGFIAAVWYVGATAADIVGYYLYDIDGGWRWMLGSTCIPCIILLIGRWGTPESPRWLVRKGRVEEARAIVQRLFGVDVALETGEVKKTRYSKIFEKGYFRRIIFIGIIWICQVVPMFGLYTFGPQILNAFGFEAAKQAIWGDIVISLFFLIGCIPAMFWLNSIGRRPLLIGSFAIMSIALAVLEFLPNANIWVVIVSFGIYAFFSGGPGILQWLYPNELFPTEIRASAVGAVMAFSRIGTVLSTYALPIFMKAHGIRLTMLVGVAISVLGLIVSIIMAPETKGLTLDESSSLKY
ncbi:MULTISPECIES: MFS transporter [unclassified Sporolactobacillus]|uniref:MFS transporter n=1 Tax=unclassified Sporolactobacillus TaxID=2628533 RepID=UPI002368630E|nr:MFS transporter [Sporolactobacillus sp. CQH2019]MDD9150080.1 MFS transporter [Sporolactobacillus sp. CQH2019]